MRQDIVASSIPSSADDVEADAEAERDGDDENSACVHLRDLNGAGIC